MPRRTTIWKQQNVYRKKNHQIVIIKIIKIIKIIYMYTETDRERSFNIDNKWAEKFLRFYNTTYLTQHHHVTNSIAGIERSVVCTKFIFKKFDFIETFWVGKPFPSKYKRRKKYFFHKILLCFLECLNFLFSNIWTKLRTFFVCCQLCRISSKFVFYKNWIKSNRTETFHSKIASALNFPKTNKLRTKLEWYFIRSHCPKTSKTILK